MTRSAVCLSLLAVLMFGWEAGASPPLRSTSPISVRSDRLQTDTEGRTALFTGHVVATQDDLTIYADSLTVVYSDQKKEVREVRAEGNVRIIQGERLGFAGRAVYDNAKGVIRLEERPRVQQGEDTITGATILYHVTERKSVVESGSGQRVEAVINPVGGGVPEIRK